MTERKVKPVKDEYPAPGELGPVSIERWHRYRERMMAEAGPGRRPEEWWLYDRQMPPPDGPGREHIRLYELGELSEAELALFMPEWRARWEQANEPGFSYCLGQLPGTTSANLVYGAEARRRFFLWAGIPPAIRKTWAAERRR
ncbi:MAG: hypothetical protein ACXWKB_08325 [Methyloceanibacter sp.]